MKLTTKQRTLGIFILALILLYLFGQSLLNAYLHRELPKIIAQKNDTPYNLEYKKVEFIIALGKLSLSEVSITPKDKHVPDSLSHFYGQIKQISIQGVDYFELIKNHNIKASKITLNTPDFQVTKAKGDIITSKKHNKVTNSVDIHEIRIKNAHVRIEDIGQTSPMVEIFNFNAQVNQVEFSQQTKNKPIPFTYKDYTLEADSVYASLNEHLKLHLGSTKVTTDDLVMDYAKIKPIGYNQYTNDNILRLDLPDIKLSKIDWGYDNENIFYLTIGQISTPSAKLDILQHKIKTQQQMQEEAKKILPTLIPFNLSIEQIAINNLYFNSLDTWKTSGATILLNNIKNTINQKLHLQSIQLNDAAISHFPKQTFNSPSVKLKQITDHILIDSFAINNANLIVKHSDLPQNTLEINSINSLVRNIVIDPKTTLKKVPFSYSTQHLTTKKVHYNTNKTYDLYLESISLNDTELRLANFLMKPKYSRAKIVKDNKTAVDIYNVQANDIKLANYQWHFDQKGVFNLQSKQLVASRVNANIYRDKTPPHDTIYKPLFSQSLRELNFGLQIDNTQIVQSTLEYEEYDEKAVAPGKLTFSNFYANIDHIYSGYGQSNIPDTYIRVDARFMNAAPLVVNWKFNVLNKQDQFNINGTIKGFPSDAMDPFIQPYIKASTSGRLDLVEFNFTGNNEYATGQFAMDYNNLKVTLYQKDGKIKRNFLSAVGNLFIRKNTKGKVITKDIREVKRTKEKSFFNYLWLCVLQGLKQTIL
ncbi:AsmA family protein [Myroides sp. LJL115]